MKLKHWIMLFSFVVFMVICIVFISSSYLIKSIESVSMDFNTRLKEDPRLSKLQNIPIKDMQNYSRDFDYAMDQLTSEFPAPLNLIVYEYIDQKSFGDLRREFEDQDISTLSDVIIYVESITIRKLRKILFFIYVGLVLFWLIAVIILIFYEKDEKKRKKEEEKAIKERKILL